MILKALARLKNPRRKKPDREEHAKDPDRAERELRIITDHSQDLISRCDLTGTILWHSPSIKKLGYSAEEIVGKRSFDFFHPEDRDRLKRELAIGIAKTFLHVQEGTTEVRFRKKNGDYVWLESLITLEMNRFLPASIVTISRDVTERKKVETLLIREQEVLRVIISRAKDLFILADSSGRLFYVSPSFEKVTGLSASLAQDFLFGKYTHPSDRDMIKTKWSDLTENGSKIVNHEFRLVDQFGIPTKTLSLSCERITLDDGRPKYQIILSDISEKKRKEKELTESLTAEKSSAILSHDLFDLVNKCHATQSLVAIVLEKLRKGETGPRDIESMALMLSHAHASGKQLEGHILQLQAYSDFGKPVLALTNMSNFLVEQSNLYASFYALSLAMDLPAYLPPTEIDPKQIGRVIENLFREAKDSYPVESPTKPISVSATLADMAPHNRKELAAGAYLMIRLESFGESRSEESLHRAFDVQFPEPGEDRNMRLYTVRSILKKHFGNIFLENIKNPSGSRFDIYLPITSKFVFSPE